MKYLILSMLCALVWASPAMGAEEGFTFTAKVLEVSDQRVITDEYTQQHFTQQDLKLEGLDGEYRGKRFEVNGVSDIQVIGAKEYRPGDRVLVSASTDGEGATSFYVIDYVRTNVLGWLTAFFLIVLFGVGWWKGIKAAVSLAFSFFIILKLVLPNILGGTDPVLISIIGSILILVVAIYLTEGWNRASHVSIASVAISLLITGGLSIIFTRLAHLAGTGEEEALLLLGQLQTPVNFQGLLLAGMIIGTLGVLDDVIISQVAGVQQLLHANPSISRRELIARAYHIGVSHIGSVTNTLFLVYAGSALPLLMLFTIETDRQLGFMQIINLEQVATEIVRTLVGSIGIMLSMPIATVIAAHILSPHESYPHEH